MNFDEFLIIFLLKFWFVELHFIELGMFVGFDFVTCNDSNTYNRNENFDPLQECLLLFEGEFVLDINRFCYKSLILNWSFWSKP